MKDEMQKKQQEALFKYGLIAPVVTNSFPDKSKQAYYERISKEIVYDHNKARFRVGVTTLKDWEKKYRLHGLDGLTSTTRKDSGCFRVMSNEIAEKIEEYLEKFPKLPTKVLYNHLVAEKFINKEQISLSTVNRYVNRLPVDNVQQDDKPKLRYECEFANDVWYGDTVFCGHIINEKNESKKICIIILLDDASRMVVGAEAFYNDNYQNLLRVMKSAVSSYGVPKMFSYDNGSNYRSHDVKLAIAKLGANLLYCRVRNPIQKAKLERLNKTLKMQWLSLTTPTSFKNLDEVNKSLRKYIQKYINSEHSSLNGLSPYNRWKKDYAYVKQLDVNKIEEAFLIEVIRKVTIDCVVQIANTEYVVPSRFCRQKVTFRYDLDRKKAFIFENKQYMEIFELDKVANSKISRLAYGKQEKEAEGK